MTSIDYIEKEQLPTLPQLSDEQKSILEGRGVIQNNSNQSSSDNIMSNSNELTVIIEESINTIQTAVTTVVQETVTVYECESDGDYYGLKKSEAREFYEIFIQAYVSKGPMYLPNLNEFHRFYTLIDEAKGKTARL